MKGLKFFFKNMEGIIGGIALTGMIVLTCTNVILRYVFNNSIIAISEIAVICMTWAVFLGSAEAYKRNQHFGMDFLMNHLKPRLRRVLRQLITLILVVLFFGVSYWGFLFSFTTMKKTAFLLIPYTWIDLPVGLGFLSMAIHALVYLVQSFVSPEKFDGRYIEQDSMTETVEGGEQ